MKRPDIPAAIQRRFSAIYTLLENKYYFDKFNDCLLYTSDAADERSSVDLGGRRIIKKKNTTAEAGWAHSNANR